MNVDKLSNIVGAETIKEIYKDGLSEPTKESSKILVDLIKTLKLFTLPLQYGAMYQDRLSKHLDKVRNNVPVENQVQATPSVAGPILEKLKYLEDDNYLTELYLNLLSRAIDKERINEAHPAFKSIIDQLSPDEAMLLYLIGKEPIIYNYTEDYDKTANWFNNRVTIKDSTDVSRINFPDHFGMYIDHLQSLNLVRWNIIDETPIYTTVENKNIQTGITVLTNITLNKFGTLFHNACIPEQGFIIMK